MTKRFRCGLVVGKFSPLHLGHELVLKTALSRCDRVLAISYSNPELPGCSSARRAAWMSELFPEVRHLALDSAVLDTLRTRHPALPRLPENSASEQVQRSFVAQVCWQVWGAGVDAVFTSESYGDSFAADLTEQLRSLGGASTQVEHVLVDLERSRVPVSASAIRQSPELAKRYLSPAVYASFVRRVCVLGGESSGKTTLVRALAARFSTSVAAEYGRELWLGRQGELEYDDFLQIARTQVEREEQAARVASDVMFGDTSPLTTLFYCQHQFGRAERELHDLADRKYDLALLCAPDFPFVQDGTRKDAAFRADQQAFYLRELERRRVDWLLVVGPPEVRVAMVERRLAGLLR